MRRSLFWVHFSTIRSSESYSGLNCSGHHEGNLGFWIWANEHFGCLNLQNFIGWYATVEVSFTVSRTVSTQVKKTSIRNARILCERLQNHIVISKTEPQNYWCNCIAFLCTTLQSLNQKHDTKARNSANFVSTLCAVECLPQVVLVRYNLREGYRHSPSKRLHPMNTHYIHRTLLNNSVEIIFLMVTYLAPLRSLGTELSEISWSGLHSKSDVAWCMVCAL